MVLVVLGFLAGAVSIPAVWLRDNVVDREGFLAVTHPLVDSSTFRQDVVEETVDLVASRSPLPQWANDRLEPLVRDGVTALAETQTAERMWDATMDETHAQLFGSAGPIEIAVDLQPAVDAVVVPVNDLLPGDYSIPVPKDTRVELAQVPRTQWLAFTQKLDPWAGRVQMAALVLGVAAILIASRRRVMLVAVGVAVAMMGLSAAVMAAGVEQWIPNVADQVPIVGLIVRAFEEKFAADVAAQIPGFLGVGGGIVVIAGLALLIGRRRS